MKLHRTTGRWRVGLALAFTTSCLWGVLPIALKLALATLDALTVTWFRFTVAAAVMAFFVLRPRRVRGFGRLDRTGALLLAAAAAGLCGNYLVFLLGLDHLSPATAQVVVQLAPVFLLLGGLVLFRESFNRLQWGGLALLLSGMVLFFNTRLGDLLAGRGGELGGVALIVGAAALWAVYGLSQKQLLSRLPSPSIMAAIYTAGAVAFLPAARPAAIAAIDLPALAVLLFCAGNTLAAYGCFAESLAHWEASRVGAVVAVTPLMTVAAVQVGGLFFPGLMEWEEMNGLSVAGAVLVVAGSMTCALSRSQPVPAARGAGPAEATPPGRAGPPRPAAAAPPVVSRAREG